MAKKPLTINLADKNSVSRVIKKVQDAKTKVSTAHNRMIMKLTEDLVMQIKASATATLGLSWVGESIRATYITGADGLLIGQIWGADYIVYIEYGTGAVGAASPSPNAPAGYMPQETHMVNVKGQIVERDYWVYYDDRFGFVSTRGQAPRPFIRTAVENFRMKVQKKAEVAFYE